MNKQLYFLVSGSIFGVVGVLHLLRVLNQWQLLLGSWSVPMWVSVVGAIVPLFLCVCAFRLAVQGNK